MKPYFRTVLWLELKEKSKYFIRKRTTPPLFTILQWHPLSEASNKIATCCGQPQDAFWEEGLIK